MARGEKEAGDCEPRRQGWEKPCLLSKEKAHETGDTGETGGRALLLICVLNGRK